MEYFVQLNFLYSYQLMIEVIFQNSEYGNGTNVIAFMLYTSCVLSTILAYCYIGECLITEVIMKNGIIYLS